MSNLILFSLLGAVIGSALGVVVLAGNAAKQGAIVGVAIFGIGGAISGGMGGADLDASMAKSLAVQKQMRAEAVAKYRLILDKDIWLPTRSDSDSRPVVAFVDGQARECSFRVVSGEPYVFCGAGVEADRAR